MASGDDQSDVDESIRTAPGLVRRSPSAVHAPSGCGTEHGRRRASRRLLSDGRWLGLGEFRLVYAPVLTVGLLPQLLQRDVAAFTAQLHLDAAEPVTRVFDDERRLRADGHDAATAVKP